MVPRLAWLAMVPALSQVPAPEAGPAVGQSLPPFEAPDQHGVPRTFANLTGANGLVLVFFRSADW